MAMQHWLPKVSPLSLMYLSNWSFNIPPWVYPRNLTLCCAQGVENLTVKAFQGVGNLKTAWEGWGIWTNCLGVMLPVSALVRERFTLEDFKGQNCALFATGCKREGCKSFAPYFKVCFFLIFISWIHSLNYNRSEGQGQNTSNMHIRLQVFPYSTFQRWSRQVLAKTQLWK